MDYFAIVLSNHSVNSQWVQRELQIALSKELSGKRDTVLPILLHSVDIPVFLRDKVYADFTTPESADKSFRKLLKALGRDDVDTSFPWKQVASNQHKNNGLIADITRILKGKVGTSSLYLAPSIPLAKLVNAREVCGVPGDAQILALAWLGTSIAWWNWGKYAVVFTEKGIHYRTTEGRHRRFISYEAFPDYEFDYLIKPDFNGRWSSNICSLKIGDDSLIPPGGVPVDALSELLNMIKIIVERTRVT
jgi:hypothetical protein